METNAMRSPSPADRAFTLVEMMVVMFIIMVLAGLAFVVYDRSIQSARRTKAMNLVGEVEKATQLFKGDVGRLPNAGDENIFIDLCGGSTSSGEGKGAIFENGKKYTVPLSSYSPDMFAELSSNTYYLKDPWWDADDAPDQIIFYRDSSGLTDNMPSGATLPVSPASSAGVERYVFSLGQPVDPGADRQAIYAWK